MRSEVPARGRSMSFPEWSEAIVAGVRRYLPDARAVRKGGRVVIIHHTDREAQLVDDGGATQLLPDLGTKPRVFYLPVQTERSV